MSREGPKWAQEDFFPTNPDLADILGRTDVDFENFYFWDYFAFQLPRFPGPQKSGLGQAWASGPGLGLTCQEAESEKFFSRVLFEILFRNLVGIWRSSPVML